MTYQVIIPNEEQLFAAVLVGMEMWEESPVYRGMIKDIDQMFNYAQAALRNKNTFLRVVLDDNDDCVGFITGYLSQFGYAKESIARDQLIFITPEHRGIGLATLLITEFEKWAKEKGAKLIILSSSAGVEYERTAALYNMLGYETVGIMTKKDVSHVL